MQAESFGDNCNRGYCTYMLRYSFIKRIIFVQIWSVKICSIITIFSIAVVLSNNLHRLSAPPKNTFIVKHMAKRSVMKETIIQDIWFFLLFISIIIPFLSTAATNWGSLNYIAFNSISWDGRTLICCLL